VKPKSYGVENCFELATKTAYGDYEKKEYSMLVAATAKLRKPKHVRTRGTDRQRFIITRVNSAFYPSREGKSSTGLPGWGKGGTR